MNPSFELSIFAVPVVTDPKVLIEGVLFRARYLGSTQLVSFFPAQFFIVVPQNPLPPATNLAINLRNPSASAAGVRGAADQGHAHDAGGGGRLQNQGG